MVCGGTRAAFRIRRTPPKEGVAKRTRTIAYKPGTLTCYTGPPPKGSPSQRPFRKPQAAKPCRVWCFAATNDPTITQKQHPSAAPGPFSKAGFPRLCSLYVVICVFCCDFGYGKTRKSPRTTSRDRETGKLKFAIRSLFIILGTILCSFFCSRLSDGTS